MVEMMLERLKHGRWYMEALVLVETVLDTTNVNSLIH